jgi:hypothetical protein
MKYVRTYRRGHLITESKLEYKTIISVDIQPEYEDGISFDLYKWAKFINKSFKSNDVVFLYNGATTLGMISEYDYKMWLSELGVKDQVIDESRFYDKGFAFFRYCMDNSIDEDSIVDLVKYMKDHNITDSRSIDEEMWNDFMEETNHSGQEVRDLLEYAADMICVPDLMNFLDRYRNIVLTGGGVTECLKEVEIALMALNKKYEILAEYTF